MHSPCHCHSQRRAEKDKKKQKKEASLIAVGVGATAAAVQKNRTLVDNDDPAAWLIAAGIILPTKVDDEQSTVEKQSPVQKNTVEKQNMELEKAAKKANVLAFMMNKQEQKNVLCPATLHAHGVICLSLNFHHICDIRYTRSRSLFLWYFLSPKTNAKCCADARGLRFPYWPPPQNRKNLWTKNFHICTGGRLN